MKIAILHEMLVKLGGAEKVVKNWIDKYPNADLFTLIYDEKKVGDYFQKNKIHSQVFKLKTQKTYNLFKKQRFCLPYMAQSIEKLDFSKYDVVLCSSSGFAHGAITKPETKFIVYYHSPTRYIWDWTNEYKKDLGLNKGFKKYFLSYYINSLFLKLRQWDYIASKRADINIANSKNTAGRIMKYYRKKSEILYPPVEINRFNTIINIKYNKYTDYYVIISTLTEFKKIEIAINAFNKIADKTLIIIGNGDYKEQLIKISKTNIIFIGAKYGNELVSLVQNSNGLIFPGEEDFGIVPIEVMAAGKPIFSYRGGGLIETNIEGITGEFFNKKDGSDFISKFKIFDTNNKKGKYSKKNCINQANLFSEEKFEKRIEELINN